MHMLTAIQPLLLLYLAAINIFTFVFFGADKYYARKGKWRIPERTLLLLAVIGGSPCALLGMLLFQHKIRKNKFRIGIPVILILQAMILCTFICTRYF